MKMRAELGTILATVACCVASAADLGMHRNDEWRSVPVDRVRLDGPLGRRVALTATNNLMRIDLEGAFFKPFREKKSGGGFIGLGKLLDGAVYLAKYMNDPAVTARKCEIARVLAETQDADGYIGYFAPGARLKALWDLHEMGFILQGLVSDWELFGEKRSLEAARKAADYIMRNWASLPDGWEFNFITDRETTLGLGHGFIRLAAATGERKYLDFARNERALLDWNAPIVLGRGKMYYGQAYGYLGTVLEQLELYGQEANPKLLRFITYQFLFYDRLLRLGQGDAAQLGDLMERLALNALPAAQSRDGRRLRYYTPLNGHRKYWGSDSYCCPNNFRRAMGRLPGYVYYEKDGAILANLFEASTAQLDVGTAKVRVTCDTDYPVSGKVFYTLDPERPAQFAFMFRLPKWCKEPKVLVNGKLVTYPCAPGEMMSLPRVWKKGDVVAIDLPMEIRCVKGRKRQSGRFAVMRGPLLYALDTNRVKTFEKAHPLDAATVIRLDPAQLVFKPNADGGRSALCGTAIATRANVIASDWRIGPNDPEVLLTEFADEDNTLTYFRTPDIQNPLFVDDELFGGK